MKKFLTAAFITVTSVFAASQVNAQSKIGYISTEELISVMPETAKADSNLQQYRGALIQSAQDKQTSLESAIAKFNTDSSGMTSAVKDVKRTDLQKMLTELQGEDQRIQQQLQSRQQELIQPINKKAFEAIQAVAKESGYTYVFEKNALLVAPPAEDILPLVAKKLNVKLPAPGAKTGTGPGAPQQQRPAAPIKK
ncbi:MAG: OmpH family outer membrane protein [Chitinophagaceae bacterium]|nr:OmpH family outer membrane protein [Chitinophagaceae bacterium]